KKCAHVRINGVACGSAEAFKSGATNIPEQYRFPVEIRTAKSSISMVVSPCLSLRPVSWFLFGSTMPTIDKPVFGPAGLRSMHPRGYHGRYEFIDYVCTGSLRATPQAGAGNNEGCWHRCRGGGHR